MKNKISKEELKVKSDSIKNLIKDVVDDTVKIPNDTLVFLNYDDLLEIFTKKRLELIKLIVNNKPKSLQELAEATKRKKQAVNRDLKILEKHEVLSLTKKGRNVIPQLNKQLILYPLNVPVTKIDDKMEDRVENGDALVAEIYIDGENINQKMNAAGW